MNLLCVRWGAAAAVLLALIFFGLEHSFPLLPGKITLELTLPAGRPATAKPLITTGAVGAGDFLLVRYIDATTVVFAYDSWGRGGPQSAPVTITPGARRSLVVEMPSLAALTHVDGNAHGPLRITYDGRDVLTADVKYFGRRPDQIFFAENPNLGTSAEADLRGEITTPEGLRLRGRPTALFPWRVRLAKWLTTHPWQVLATFLLTVATALAAAPVRSWFGAHVGRDRPEPIFAGHARAPHGWFVAIALICTLVFSWIITGGTFRFFETESFEAFYDYQAVSLLHGRLDVPEPALITEAFIFEGKYYGYFGPTPALQRLPFALLGVRFGQWSRCCMVADYLACLAAAYALLIHAARLLSRAKTWPSRFDVVVLIGGAGLGSTLFFTASRAYIYHEAILCGAAFALWSSYCSLRWLAALERRWWLGALVCGVLSVHARPPAGLFALAVLGSAALVHLWRQRAAGPRAWSRPLAIGALSVLGVLSFNALSYLKFKSFEGAPLKYHIQYNPDRLSVIEGRNFHTGNFRYDFDAYVWRPNFRFVRTFPYFEIQGRSPGEYADTHIDVAEPTLALPYAMPALCLLSIIAIGLAIFRWPGSRLSLAMLLAGTLPMALALFTAIAISQRYTADFCPPLLATAAFGLAAISILPRGWQRTLRTLLTILTLWAVFVALATTLHYQGESVWGVRDTVKQNFQTMRKKMDDFFGASRP